MWQRPNSPTGCAGGCLGIFLFIVIGGFVAFSGMMASCLYLVSAPPTTYHAAVDRVSWERTIEIERSDWRSKEGPDDHVPPDAIDVKQKGQTGIFTFKVREWRHDRTLRAAGTDHSDIRWPVDTSQTNGVERDPNEREAHRERYTVAMRYAGERVVGFVVKDEATFRKFQIESTHVITPMQGYVLIGGERYDHP